MTYPSGKGLFLVNVLIYIFVSYCFANSHGASWQAEYDVSLQSALSSYYLKSPLGVIDSSVRDVFQNYIQLMGVNSTSLEQIFLDLKNNQLIRGKDLYILDGTGIGQILFSYTAFLIFGASLKSLTILCLSIFFVSCLIIILRFNKIDFTELNLFIIALDAVILSPVFQNQNIYDQIPIGGNRFFVILAIIPSFYFYHLIDRDNYNKNLISAKNNLCDLIMLFIISSIITIRSSCILIFLAPFFYNIISKRISFYKLSNFYVPLVIIISITISNISPYYSDMGRSTGIVWHRVFASFVFHPKWPFEGIHELYRCSTHIPQGISSENADQNVHCVWWAYSDAKGINEGIAITGVYGARYESVVRDAVLKTFWENPRESIMLFLFYKPIMLFQTLKDSFKFSFQLLGLINILCALSIFFNIMFLSIYRSRKFGYGPSHFLIFISMLSIFPSIVAWPSLWTSIDVIVLVYVNSLTVFLNLTSFLFRRLVKIISF